MVVLVTLLAGAALSAVAASKSSAADFSGTWKLNMSKSKGAPDWRPDTVIVVFQSPYQIHFSYFLSPEVAQPFQTLSYAMNGKESQLYVTANEHAYVSARWDSKKELLVRTRHVVPAEVGDTAWDETDTWLLADSGKTLINKLSDGKVLVYEKQAKDKQ